MNGRRESKFEIAAPLDMQQGRANSISRRGLFGRRVTVAAGLMLAGCAAVSDRATPSASQVGSSIKEKKVGFSIAHHNQLRWKAGDQRFFEEEAKRLGLVPIVAVANASVATQLSQVRTMLAQNIDALVISPVDSVAAAVAANEAIKAGIPVVSYNFLIEDAKLSAFVGRDGVQVGRDLAMAALEAKPEGNYVLLFGDQGTVVARDKAAGMLEVLKPAIDSGKIKVVSQQYVKGWSPDLARELVAQACTANDNKIVSVVGSSDTLARGAVQALVAAGINNTVFVTGEDAEYATLKSIQGGGGISVSSFTDFASLGKAAAQTVATLLSGKPLETKYFVTNPNKVPWVRLEAFNVSKPDLTGFAAKYPWWTNSTFTGAGA
jgi:D-xylose transport system substrate-binding protein